MFATYGDCFERVWTDAAPMDVLHARLDHATTSS